MDLLNRTYSQLFGLYRSMTPAARLAVGLMIVAVAGTAGYLRTHATVVAESDLMRGLPLAAAQLPAMEAAFAKATLQGYKVRGTSIFVPRGQEAVYMAALVDAKALPRDFGAAQHEAANSGGMFDFGPQRVERMRIAKQDVLAQAICKINGIESACVLCDVDSRPGPFKERVLTATALVKPAGGGHLDDTLVSAIRKMVAGTIAGMKPENVAVSDLGNGRTWYGNPEEGTASGENLGVSLKRTWEQDLKTKILNALCFIPSVTVEATVLADLERLARLKSAKGEKESLALTPTVARVSVGVPMSYFRKVWQERNAAETDRMQAVPRRATLDQIRLEESVKIQRHVAQLLPSVESVAKAADLVAVTPFEDLPLHESPLPAADTGIRNWLRNPEHTAGVAAATLIGLLLLRSLVRTRPAACFASAAAKASSTAPVRDRATDPGDPRAKIIPATIPRPHAKGFHAAVAPRREELSEWVEDDPDGAANVLRSWIGHEV
jgi:flagellar biosynthesis/type III secretory pathway M-ring protein FliF/YscJ